MDGEGAGTRRIVCRAMEAFTGHAPYRSPGVGKNARTGPGWHFPPHPGPEKVPTGDFSDAA